MPSHNTNAQKGKAKAKETAPPAPKPDTSEVELQTLMRNAKVKVLIVEALGNAEFVAADPLKQEMGKKKNHWVLRFLIANPIIYYKAGRIRTCESVRVSVETPETSLTCRSLTLKAMQNGMANTRSPYVSFHFNVPAAGLTVKNFMDAANPLLPFTYRVVARTLTDKPGAPGRAGPARQSGRNQELAEHPNGCRDFTAQWFYLLHQAGYVVWETHKADHVGKNVQPIQDTEAFHHIIGYRYSPSRIDRAPIAKATFDSGHVRQLNCMVELIMNPESGQLMKAPGSRKYKVVLPYQDQPPALQTFRKS